MSSGPQQQPAPAPPYRPYRQVRAATHHSRAVSCVRFSPCGRLLATAPLDGTVALLSPSSLAVIATLRGHAAGVSDLSWSTESFYLCSASDDRTLRIWDIRPIFAGANPGGQPAAADPGADRCVRVLKGHTNFVFTANFNPQTSSQVASGGFDCTVRIWDVRSGRCTRAIDAHSEPVTSVHFIGDGSIIVSGSHDGSCKIWDAKTGACLKTVIDDKKPAVSFSMFSPNGKFILVATLDDSLAAAAILRGPQVMFSSNKNFKSSEGVLNHVNKLLAKSTLKIEEEFRQLMSTYSKLLSLITCLIVSPSLCGQQKAATRMMMPAALSIHPKAWRLPYIGPQH